MACSKTINQARKELFTLPTSKTSNLRRQIETQLMDTSTTLMSLVFKGTSNIPLITLKFQKNLLADTDFMTWGKYLDETTNKWKGMTDYKNKLIDTNVQNMVKLLTNLIAEHGSGKVIILPAINTNNEKLGYRHYYGEQAKHTTWLPLNSYFEIDLSDSATALSQLIHISYSVQAYDAAFVVKEWVDIKETYGDVKNYLEQNKVMICAFDYRGFLKKDEIYVGDPTFFGHPTVKPRAPILIEDYSTDFYDNRIIFDSYVNRWDNTFFTHAGMTVSGNDSDFIEYMNKIRTGTSEFEKIMYDILFGPRPST